MQLQAAREATAAAEAAQAEAEQRKKAAEERMVAAEQTADEIAERLGTEVRHPTINPFTAENCLCNVGCTHAAVQS